MSTSAFLPRASVLDVLRGHARIVGTRLDPSAPRGLVSPIEARANLGLDYGDLAGAEVEALERPTLSATARALIAATLTSPLAFRRRQRIARPFVVSAAVDNVTVAEALERIVQPGPLARARMVHFVHIHALNLAHEDAALRARLRDADLVLPDGLGLRLAAVLLATPLVHNVNGTDLLPLLCERLREERRPLALIGGRPGVARACADNLVMRYPGLRLAAVEHGFLGDDAARALRKELARGAPPVVLIGMGSPIQEAFAWNHLADLPGATVVTVGGLFDFYSGSVARASSALRDVGLEWVHRLALEPRRMARRYLVGNPVFVGRVLTQRAVRDRASRNADPTITR